MTIVVSDASVLIDLERGALLQVAFSLPHIWVVPYRLYRRELEPFNGAELVGIGLHAMRLTDAGLSLAADYRTRERRLTLEDAYALALAKLGGQTVIGEAAPPETAGGHPLLSGDRALRELAVAERVECRGLFWVLDEIEAAGLLSGGDLEIALSAISAHPRRRLPSHEVTARIIRYRQNRGG